MSRVGKKIRMIPSGVTAEVKNGEIIVKGPKGELKQKLHPRVSVEIMDGQITLKVANEKIKKERALWGTFSSLIQNMLDGVTKGYKKELEINGVGFKVAMKGSDLSLEVGYSHPVLFKSPAGIKLSVDKNIVTVEGNDRQVVGETAAQIRAIKKPEPYKGKGIRYVGEIVRQKAGKAAAKSASA